MKILFLDDLNVDALTQQLGRLFLFSRSTSFDFLWLLLTVDYVTSCLRLPIVLCLGLFPPA